MATYTTATTANNIPAVGGSSIPRVMSAVLNMSTQTNVAGDIFEMLEIPANTLVLCSGIDILGADTAGNSGTVILGDGGDDNRYVAAAATTSAGQMTPVTSTGTNYVYAAADTIDIKTATGAMNGLLRAWAVVASLDSQGLKTDTDSQTLTFA